MNLNDILNTLALGFALLCILPMILLAIGGYFFLRFAQRQISSLHDPNADKLFERYQALYTADKNHDTSAHMRKIINEQAFRCGTIGFITGLGGFITLPIAIPLDYILSTQTQAAMVRFIARAYGQESAKDSQMIMYAVLSGGETVTRYGTSFFLRLLPRFVGKWFSKLIPFFGAFISFTVNYFFAQSLGRAMMIYYSQRTRISTVQSA
jgi:hypothetical protein